MFCFLLILSVNLVQPSLGEVLNDGEVFQVYPNLEDVQNGTTPLYFALMQSFSGGYVSAGGIPGLMVALDEINNSSNVLPGYSLHYTLTDNAVSPSPYSPSTYVCRPRGANILHCTAVLHNCVDLRTIVE